VELALVPADDGKVLLSSANGSRSVSIARWPGHITLFVGAAAHAFAIPDPFEAAHEGAGGDAVIAPMPGLVKIVHAQAGESLAKGAALLVLEAMKMEHVLTAPRDCVVANVDVAAGDQVTEGRLLVALLPEAGE